MELVLAKPTGKASSHLEDACLLPSDVFQSLSQDGDMIDSEGRDSSYDRLGDYVRTVISSADAYFEHCSINLEKMRFGYSVLKPRQTLSCRNAWYATNVRKRKYPGMIGAFGFAV